MLEIVPCVQSTAHAVFLHLQYTIEEKVIERAYKKLALDALVIQQGRLAEQKGTGTDSLLPVTIITAFINPFCKIVEGLFQSVSLCAQ